MVESVQEEEPSEMSPLSPNKMPRQRVGGREKKSAEQEEGRGQQSRD